MIASGSYRNVGKFALLAGAVAGVLLYRRYRYDKRHRFTGKVVAITGGSRGLGLEIARRLAREGARLAICARSQEPLERAADELRQTGCDVIAVPCDITKPEEATDFVQRVIDRWGRIDVLVNNAGIIQAGPIECMTRADFEKSMATHFWGPLYLIEASLPAMRSQGEGQIVNISSIGGEISVPHLVPYCAGKFALVGLSEGLSVELAKDGIRVTTVCPGLMRTGSPRNAEFKGQYRAEYAWFSISDSLPVLSICSRTAARRIVRACRRGTSYVRLTLPAQIGVRVRTLFPRLVGRALKTTNQLLPGPRGNKRSYRGHESFSRWSPSLLTYLTEQAAARNNELPDGR